MFEALQFDSEGKKVLCEMGGKNAGQHQTIIVYLMKKGQTLVFDEKENETAALLTQGKVKFSAEGKELIGERANPFEMKPYAVHVSKGVKLTIEALADNTEIVTQRTNNEKTFPTEWYNPENCLYQEFGKGQWDGCGYRVVSTMFDPDNAPDSNMVMGEVFNKPGRWSSYPPHHHPQPETYYYRFDKPQGFGACFNGDNVYKSVDGSYCTIFDGMDHEQVTAPGYTMYYVWMIRHNDGDKWYKTTRIVSDEHKWLLEK